MKGKIYRVVKVEDGKRQNLLNFFLKSTAENIAESFKICAEMESRNANYIVEEI